MKFKLFLITLLFCISKLLFAATYPLPSKNDALVGHLQTQRVGLFENFHTMGKEHDMGFDNMALANPKYNPNSPPAFYKVLIPSDYILPPGARKGIVINLPEMRLYYYVPKKNEVMIFPVGVGKQGWETPEGSLHIIKKIKNPTWVIPANIKRELVAKGYHFGNAVKPGPMDPLGHYALRLSNPNYLIHGTDYPPSIGTRASSGCIRLFGKDIDTLFHAVEKGTQVRIIDDPYKAGFKKGKLYLSAFPTMTEDQKHAAANLTPMVEAIDSALKMDKVKVNWQRAIAIAMQHNGIPQVISE